MPLLRFVEMWVFRQFAHLLPTLLRLLFYEQVFFAHHYCIRTYNEVWKLI